MKKIYLAIYDGSNDDETLYEEAMSDYETNIAETGVKEVKAFYQDLSKPSDEFLLELSRVFQGSLDKMYMLSNIEWNYYGETLSDEDKIKVGNATFNTWLKDESGMSSCRISDRILSLIEDGKLTVDEALKKSGRELLRVMNY